MAIFHLISEEETFKKRLIERLGNSTYAILASAFFTYGAFAEIKSSLLDSLERGAKIDFLLGKFDFVTEPRAVRGLLKLSEKFPNQMKIHFDDDFSFHYKIALFK